MHFSYVYSCAGGPVRSSGVVVVIVVVIDAAFSATVCFFFFLLRQKTKQKREFESQPENQKTAKPHRQRNRQTESCVWVFVQ